MKPQHWVVFTLGLVFLGTALQLAGVIAPMWIWLEPDSGAYTIGVGLYFRVGCESSSGAACPAAATDTFQFGYTDAATYDGFDWPHITWLQTMGAAVALILCVMATVYTIGFGSWRWLGWLNAAMVFAAIFTWLPIAAGLILYAVEHGRVITTSPDLSSRSFPWSALMSFLAGIIFVIVTILIRAKCRVRRYVKNAIPTSADSKMILNPSTKSQLINKFFTPSPYREDRRQAIQSSAYYNDQSALLGSGSFSRAITSGAVTGVENNARAIEYNNNNSNSTSKIHVIEESPYSYSRVINRSEELSTPLVRTGRIEQHEQIQVQQNQERQQLQQQILQEQQLQQQQRLQQQQQQLQLQEQHMRQQQLLRQQQQNVVARTTTTTTNQYRNGVERNSYNGQQALARPQPPTPVDRRQEERVVGHETLLNRHGQVRAFDEATDNDDAETIFYTGREEVRPRPLFVDTNVNRVDGYRSDMAAEGYRSAEAARVTSQQDVRQTGFVQQTGYVQQAGVQQTGDTVIQEVRDIVIHEAAPAPRTRQFFRVGANQSPEEIRGSTFTVHTRTANVDNKGERVVLLPGNLRGGNLHYNDTFIYRPYSEQLY